MWDHKIAMASFCTFVRLSAKMAAKFFKKCYEWRCQGIKRRFRKPKHTNEHIKKDFIRYFVEKFWKFWT